MIKNNAIHVQFILGFMRNIQISNEFIIVVPNQKNYRPNLVFYGHNYDMGQPKSIYYLL